jgi:hypothetical protein
MSKKRYISDEDRLMMDPDIKWTSSSIIKNHDDEPIDYGNCKSCDKKLDYLGALLWDNSGYVCNDCDMSLMIAPNLDNYYKGGK